MTAKQSIAWLQAAWKDDKKRINLLLVSGLAGMLLLCMSEWLPAGQSAQKCRAEQPAEPDGSGV